MAPILSLLSLFLHLLIHLNPTQVSGGNLLFEDGYTVSTVFNGNKVKLTPRALLPQFKASDQFIVLDSATSTFYTVSLPTNSQESVIKRLAGNGQHGYVDGDSALAMFNRPRSFAVDYNMNVYVADEHNLAIRKITKSGVTTIAGGYSQKPGRTDGPARNASFSRGFELVFVPERCALLISDHGNRLIRQINLKEDDCTKHSGSVLGVSSAWLLGVGLSCLLGLVVGFIIRPYVMPLQHEGSKPRHCNGTWNHSLTSLERQIMMLCSDTRSVIVSSAAYLLFRRLISLSLSNLSLMFRLRIVGSQTSCEKPVSLMDCDESNTRPLTKEQMVAGQLKDLISFDGGLLSSENADQITDQEEKIESTEVPSGRRRKIDCMIQANFTSFAEQAPEVSLVESSECSLGLSAKKRLNATR